jgi:hypothetical protein
LSEEGGWEVYPGYDHFIFLFRTRWLEFWAETRQWGSKRGKDAEISRTLRIFGEDWHVLFVNVELEMLTRERKEDWVRNNCALTYCLFLILNKDTRIPNDYAVGLDSRPFYESFALSQACKCLLSGGDSASREQLPHRATALLDPTQKPATRRPKVWGGGLRCGPVPRAERLAGLRCVVLCLLPLLTGMGS